jgi:hypothetical protein
MRKKNQCTDKSNAVEIVGFLVTTEVNNAGAFVGMGKKSQKHFISRICMKNYLQHTLPAYVTITSLNPESHWKVYKIGVEPYI